MTRTKSVVVGALMLAATLGTASAQSSGGRLYAFQSKAMAGCPALDWHITVDSNGDANGMISWDGMKSMAHATGNVNAAAKTFSMTATEVGGQGRTATITGSLRSDGWLVADVKAPNVTCTGILVPWYTPPAGAGNG
jgi:hypothetical protein